MLMSLIHMDLLAQLLLLYRHDSELELVWSKDRVNVHLYNSTGILSAVIRTSVCDTHYFVHNFMRLSTEV